MISPPEPPHADHAVDGGERDWIASALDRFGRIDAVIANAGIMVPKTVIEGSDAELDAMWEVNVKAPRRLAQAAFPALAASGRGDVDPADALADGRAMDVWRRMIAAQDGDPDAPLPTAKHTETITATSDGVLGTLDAYAVGVAAWRLGAGRGKRSDVVQAAAGVEMHAKPGDAVRVGQPLLTLHTDTPERFDRATAALDGAVTIAPAGTEVPRAIVLETVEP